MKKVRVVMLSTLMMLLCSLVSQAQQSVATVTNAIVPPLVNFSGALTLGNGKPLAGTVGVTFSLYKDEQGGAPLWVETQNVHPDKAGHYSVMLGSTSGQGIPGNLFVAGDAHWLGVQPQGQAEQPRVLLLSVPYALKAADAETVGGLPPSAFLLAAPLNPGSSSAISSGSNSNSSSNPNLSPVSGSGTADFLPIWTNSTTLGSSVLFQSGAGAKAKVGIGTTKPASTLDVKGGGTIRGLFSLPTTGTATATAGFNSQPMDLAASVFNSSASEPVTQTFQWQAEPVGNDTGNATGSLNLLFGQGSTKPTETGLNVASNGQITFATGQTFPGTGDGTVTSVGSGLGLTGGPITTSGTLAINTTVVPQLGAAINTFTGNLTVNGSLNTGGAVSAAGSGNFDQGLNVTGDASFVDAVAVNVGNTFGVASSNNSSFQTLNLQNHAAPGTGTFLVGMFDANGKDVFDIDTKGDTFAAGSKSAVVPLRSGEMVEVFSMESPEVWFEDFGSGRLAGGATTISLDPKFTQTVNLPLGYHVFLTPKGDCKGLFVTGETNDGFEVRELSGGKSSVEFDYRIVAHRNGYEAERLPAAILPVAAKLNRAGAVINKKK